MDTREAGPWSWEVETPGGVVPGRSDLDEVRLIAVIGALVEASS